MEFRSRAGVFAFIALGVASAGQAAEPGFYFGVHVGQAEYDVEEHDIFPAFAPIFLSPLPPAVAAGVAPRPLEDYGGFVAAIDTLAFVQGSDVDFDRTDNSLLATVGYQVNQYFAAELSYVDLGTVRMEATYPLFFPLLTPTGYRQSTEIETTGIELALLGNWPITERWNVFARAGYFFADTEVKQSTRLIGVSGPTSTFDGPTLASENGILGAGVEYQIASKWSVRLEYQHYLETGEGAFFNEPDIDSFALGVLFRL